MNRSLALCLVLHAVSAAGDPVADGAALYSENCLVCHGPTASEGEAGGIRGLSLSTMTGAIRGGPGMMPAFAIPAEEIAAIIAYLARN